jgi:hypothetical protein
MQGSPELPPPPPMQPRSVADILETAFDLYRRHWVTLVQLVAIVVVPLTFLQFLLADAFSESVVIGPDGQPTIDEGLGAGLIGSSVVVGFVSLLINMLLTGAIAWAVATILVGREPNLAESYRFGYRRIWSILLVTVLSGLAVLAGLILFVIPGIFVFVRLFASVPAVVVEGRRGTDALSRSWNLVKGYGWPVFGALAVTLLLSWIVTVILSIPAGDSFLAGWIFGSIASIVTMPYMTLVIGLLYFDLRVRKEQLDVATLDRELQAAAAQ